MRAIPGSCPISTAIGSRFRCWCRTSGIAIVAKVDDFEGAGYERRPFPVYDVDGVEVIGEAAVYEFLTDRE